MWMVSIAGTCEACRHSAGIMWAAYVRDAPDCSESYGYRRRLCYPCAEAAAQGDPIVPYRVDHHPVWDDWSECKACWWDQSSHQVGDTGPCGRCVWVDVEE